MPSSSDAPSSDAPSSFDALELRPALREALALAGFTAPTPIQAEALPPMLAGADLTGQAMTGSGKTAAFGLALLQRLDLDRQTPQALVLCPTRELAQQVADELRRLAVRLPNTRVLTLCGGRPTRGEAKALDGGCHVVVGTPGRVGKHLRTGRLDLAALTVLVLDEADRMLDMGFVDQVMAIAEHCPTERQTLLFSATFPDGVAALQQAVQRDPRFVAVSAHVDGALLAQRVFHCAPDQRDALLIDLLAATRAMPALIFCQTRRDCAALADLLAEQGVSALALHGELDQRDREQVLIQLANGSAGVLVATDVAARGLDIDALPVVITYELSPDPDVYVHRVGRTGRAGQQGVALSIVASGRERDRLARVEALLGHPIPEGTPPPTGGSLAFLDPPNQTLLLRAGRRDKLRKGDVLGALVKDAGIPGDAIGRIDLLDDRCAVAIRRDQVRRALAFFGQGRIKSRRVQARLLR